MTKKFFGMLDWKLFGKIDGDTVFLIFALTMVLLAFIAA